MSLKIFDWISDILEKNLPPHIQQQLMQDLVFMATDTAFAVPPLVIIYFYIKFFS